MPSFAAAYGHPVIYHILIEPRPAGPVVGFLAGEPISEAVVDQFGRRYIYAGVAPRRRNGQYDADALRKGEWIVEPGLIYRHAGAAPQRVALG
jgi:hypothetical protein